jgi:hypothetical protein
MNLIFGCDDVFDMAMIIFNSYAFFIQLSSLLCSILPCMLSFGVEFLVYISHGRFAIPGFRLF